MDSLAAYCPWCFPKPDSEPVPGARRGPHFHYCSECGQNWQHETACSAPLRAALPECTGCRRTPAESDEGPRPEPAPTMVVRPAKTFRERVRPLALPIGIAAGVLLSLPILSKGYSALRSRAVDHSVSVTQPLPAAKPPAPTAVAPQPIAPTPSAPTPIASAPTAPTLDVARPRTEPRTAKAAPARDVSRPLPPPRISAPRTEAPRVPAIEHPSEPRDQDVRPRNDAPSIARPSAPTPGKADDSRIIPSAPAPARSEPVAESAPRTPETPPAASESGMRATPVIVTLPAIPGAPPFSGLTGSSGRDTALDGHPRRAAR